MGLLPQSRRGVLLAQTQHLRSLATDRLATGGLLSESRLLGPCLIFGLLDLLGDLGRLGKGDWVQVQGSLGVAGDMGGQLGGTDHGKIYWEWVWGKNRRNYIMD